MRALCAGASTNCANRASKGCRHSRNSPSVGLHRRWKPCATVGRRLTELSEQVTRATQLLSTRVDVSRERQNRELLESMDRRASLQLRLQQTVEGLSIAAITYYIVGLVAYAATGLQSAGLSFIDPPVVIALSIPVVLAVVAFGVRKVRTMINKDEDDTH